MSMHARSKPSPRPPSLVVMALQLRFVMLPRTGGLRARPWLMLRKPHSMLMAVRFEMAARKGVR
jgi:hypothetical protein